MSSTQQNLNEVKKALLDEWISQEEEAIKALEEKIVIHEDDIRKFQRKRKALDHEL